ncbi:hypothetical protein [Cellulosimicrobium funkei]|uniref:hypothetical protein n=1 Tax=Cellulosimicrobium funkei TaxID=264251 RepID=UPI0037DCCCA8
MSATWDYVVPALHGSPWEQYASPLVSTDLDWPTVGVYCPHAPQPWLLGSFHVSDAVLEERDEIHWGWRRDYATGDGYLIPLGRQSGVTPTQSILDDAPFDKKATTARAMRALEQHGIESEQFKRASAEMARGDSELRARIPLRCGHCSLARTFRSESVQTVMSVFWRAGVREISLETLARRVDRRATR